MSIFLAAIIVGGMGTILGGILGAVFMTMVPELLKLVVRLAARRARSRCFLAGAHHRVRPADHRFFWCSSRRALKCGGASAAFSICGHFQKRNWAATPCQPG